MLNTVTICLVALIFCALGYAAGRSKQEVRMEQEHKDKIAWLWRYRDSLWREDVLRAEYAELDSRAKKTTPMLSGMPGGSGDGQALARAVEQLIQARQELQAQINQCWAIRREVVAAIGQITDPRDREILYRRYILGQKWEQIAVEISLDERNVRRRHKRAILALSFAGD